MLFVIHLPAVQMVPNLLHLVQVSEQEREKQPLTARKCIIHNQADVFLPNRIAQITIIR